MKNSKFKTNSIQLSLSQAKADLCIFVTDECWSDCEDVCYLSLFVINCQSLWQPKTTALGWFYNLKPARPAYQSPHSLHSTAESKYPGWNKYTILLFKFTIVTKQEKTLKKNLKCITKGKYLMILRKSCYCHTLGQT